MSFNWRDNYGSSLGRLMSIRNGSRIKGPWSHFGYSSALTVGKDVNVDTFFPLLNQRDDRNPIFFTTSQRWRECEAFCNELLSAAMQPSPKTGGYYARLDEKLQTLLSFGLVSNEDPERSSQKAFRLLSRIPHVPLCAYELFNRFSFNHGQLEPYQGMQASSRHARDIWQALDVVRLVDTNLLRIAINFCDEDGDHYDNAQSKSSQTHQINLKHRSKSWSGRQLQVYLDVLTELLETACRMSQVVKEEGKEIGWFLVKAFLWTCWQRGTMLLLWFVLGAHLKYGYNFLRNLDIRLKKSPLITRKNPEGHSPYICNWAYELLQSSFAAVTMDLRDFNQRFTEHFGDRSARCDANARPCDGLGPQNCQRFVGLVVQDQSAHAYRCTSKDNCGRLVWDSVSYKKVPSSEQSGARAVDIAGTTRTHLKYRESSGRTLAISHVWSHGQGGRPEAEITDPKKGKLKGGMNQCLHERYTNIAQQVDCDSYWIDTACIPFDVQLRKEAISKINRVFKQSKVTLICDRDIQEMDISNLTIAREETILATVLASDWNVRAWTLLEAMRGRREIYLLCANDTILSLRSTLLHVFDHGSISLSILFLSAQHLLPPEDFDDYRFSAADYPSHVTFTDNTEGSALLSHRQASRPGDAVVIWSLLLEEQAAKTPAELWKRQVRMLPQPQKRPAIPAYGIPTGFLISSAPRLKGLPGLGWAPATPTLSLDGGGGKIYLAEDGQGTEVGIIWPDGLRALWGMHAFEAKKSVGWQQDVLDIVKTHEGAKDFKRVALLQALKASRGDAGSAVAHRYKGNVDAVLFAVVATADKKDERWNWCGVYEWDFQRESMLPVFEARKIVIE